MEPLHQFKHDRSLAQGQDDPMAALCTVANVDAQGNPQLRTVVLRDVDEHLAIFINTTSPKWQDLQASFAVQTYWPSVQVQYRMQVSAERVDPAVVASSWQLRPTAPKRMDWFYVHEQTQSSPIPSREVLLEKFDALTLDEPLTAPEQAAGLILIPQEIERLDLNQNNGVHQRQRFVRTAQAWQMQTLVP